MTILKVPVLESRPDVYLTEIEFRNKLNWNINYPVSMIWVVPNTFGADTLY